MRIEPEYLPAKSAAELVGRTPRWLYDARATPGAGPPFYKIGGRYFYREPEVMAWLRSKRAA
jgi:hypothetical protein